MDKVLMVKDNMVHYVPYELIKNFLSNSWKKADITKKKIEKKVKKKRTKKRNKKAN